MHALLCNHSPLVSGAGHHPHHAVFLLFFLNIIIRPLNHIITPENFFKGVRFFRVIDGRSSPCCVYVCMYVCVCVFVCDRGWGIWRVCVMGVGGHGVVCV